MASADHTVSIRLILSLSKDEAAPTACAAAPSFDKLRMRPDRALTAARQAAS